MDLKKFHPSKQDSFPMKYKHLAGNSWFSKSSKVTVELKRLSGYNRSERWHGIDTITTKPICTYLIIFSTSMNQYIWYKEHRNYLLYIRRSCISRPLIYAHQIINLWNSFFKPRAASSLSQYGWISTLPNYYSCISRPLIYAHQIINLWNSFFKPSLSQYVWISTLPNYYSCISRPFIYAHQIISLWNSFFTPRAF